MFLFHKYIIVDTPRPHPPHFAWYCWQFSKKCDPRLGGSMTAQTRPLTTPNFLAFFFCRTSHAKRSFFIKLALSPRRGSHFSFFLRSLVLAPRSPSAFVWYIRHFWYISHSLPRICQGFIWIVRHYGGLTPKISLSFSWLPLRRGHRFREKVCQIPIVTHIL